MAAESYFREWCENLLHEESEARQCAEAVLLDTEDAVLRLMTENAQLKADLIVADIVPDADDVLAPLQAAKVTTVTRVAKSLDGPTIILPAP